ncbi:MAG: hypothetical protein JWO37_141 [Acidimicrobiales bacterium]|nr:hypothetical protein [Acidimicrobiales bacterium]
MLTPFDDYAIHQTPLPLAHPVSGDPNHYDRYFFNGYDRDGEYFFGVAMALYPNRRVIDAAFSIVHGGHQRSVFASMPMPRDPGETRVGPIAIDIVEPLRVNRVRVDANAGGIEADLTYTARSVAIEEPRQTATAGRTVVMDATRITQLGTWAGAVDVGGERLTMDDAHTFGTKDRSWGVRPVGEPTPGAPPDAAGGPPGLCFLWTPLHFDDECYFLALFERPTGERWYESGGRVPVLFAGDVAYAADDRFRHIRSVDYDIDFRAGTRRSRSAQFTYRFDDDTERKVQFTPLIDFQMRGIGYTHPTFKHGAYHGPDLVVGSDDVDLRSVDPLAPENIHVEQACRVDTDDGRQGIGTFEQLIFGPHRPMGFADFLDGA